MDTTLVEIFLSLLQEARNVQTDVEVKNSPQQISEMFYRLAFIAT